MKRVSINTRYLGILLMALGIALAVVIYNFTAAAIDFIDTTGHGDTCGVYETCPHIGVLNQSYIGYAISAVIFLMGLFLAVFGGKPEAAKPDKTRWEAASKTLEGDEKTLYDKIAASGGVMFQSELVEQTGFAKAKVSRILDKMEARGLVEKRRRGMTNAIVLK
jgi:uncharacterized membrane protein